VWVRTLRNGIAVRPRRHAGPHSAAPHARSVPTDTGAPADAGTFYARTDTAAASAAADSDHHAHADPSTDGDADYCANA